LVGRYHSVACSSTPADEASEFGAAKYQSVSEHVNGIDPSVPPSGTGCVECTAAGGWWFHLRRCTQCGHIGCCDQSVGKHATAHFHATHHPIITSFEPGEDWFYDYATADYLRGPHLAAPHAHPESQPTPGPDGRVPDDWEEQLS
jgi:ubiquitin-hydrolase Zn-finger-containing protein